MFLTRSRLLCLLIFYIVRQISATPQNNVALENFDEFHKRYLLPIILSDTKNCTLNACEMLKIVSQLLLLLKTSYTANIASESKGSGTLESSTSVPQFEMDYELGKRVRHIESRLRSVEQPMWRLSPASQTEWNHCSSSVCRCNPYTKSFMCWNTRLKSVPVEQVIPLNMVSIDLSRNLLSTLHKDTFQGLTLLKELDLSNNVLDFLPFDVFRDLDSLVKLRMQSNQLEDLDPRLLWKLRNLNLLDLSKNELINLPENVFNHVQRLTVINLCENKLRELPLKLFQDQFVLEELDMSKNELSTLRAGSMEDKTQLKVLDFSSNIISTISDAFFKDLKNLRTLILHNNRITSISKKLFENLPHLLSLDLTKNHIAKIDPHAFSGLENLRELFLAQNSLSHIPDGLFLNTISLTRLTFFSNNLTSLEANDFEGLVNLKYLMLNNNILKYLDTQAFAPLKKLERLRIDSNKLQYLPTGCLSGMENLLAIKLDKNPWHCDCRALYLARWIREFTTKLWDGRPLCRGPGDLGGHEVGLLRYDDLCDGQWASMLSLSPRLPVRKHRISTPMNYSDYFNLYLKHIYSTTPKDELLNIEASANVSTKLIVAES